MGNGVNPACYIVDMIHPNRIWQSDNVLKNEFPILALQVGYVVLLSRLFFFIYQPLCLPRLISQLSVGFLLIQVVGRFRSTYFYVFPINGVLNVEVLSHIGIIYYAFLSGLEMNLNVILHVKKKAGSIALSGIIFPMVMGPALYTLHRKFYGNGDGSALEESTKSAYVIWTLVLTVTGFPVVAHSLSELKLLYTGLGESALTAAMLSDTYAWVLFTLFVPFSINGKGAIYSVVCTILFIVICIFVVRPIIMNVIDRKTEKDEWDDNKLLFVVMGLFICSYITDVLGTHAVVGAFVYGLILPHGKFSDMVVSISDDFAGGTMFATFFFGMRSQDNFALGLLLNTKGAIALIMLNIAWDRSILSMPTYAVLTSSVLLMTIVVSPLINAIYKSKKRFEQNKLKTIQKLRFDAELRILACVHNTRQATGIISLLESFNVTRLSPMHVFALHLVELTGRAAALVAAHMEKPSGQIGTQNLTKSQEEQENINNAFEAFGETYDAIRVQTLNVVSAYSTIHEDIYNSANEKRISLTILPFHKQLSSEGVLETTSVVYRDINLDVMQNAPCSVGIFVDRDFASISKMNFRVCMIFVGGPDDREAMAVAWRMAGHPGMQLSVVRILLFDEATKVDTSINIEAYNALSAVMDNAKQKELDDEYVNSFRLTAVNNDDSISYSEIDVHSGEDIPTILNELNTIECDLYIVGQGNCRNLRVFSNLLEWCDCPELGVIGDILTSSNFISRSSVLVVQQYGYGGMVFGNQSNNVTTNNDGFETL
ncbi:hypothetical protein P8452_41314 [Trifolium repens]|nr:hypothetical protein P8452_41314 [Trifolium repens]